MQGWHKAAMPPSTQLNMPDLGQSACAGRCRASHPAAVASNSSTGSCAGRQTGVPPTLDPVVVAQLDAVHGGDAHGGACSLLGSTQQGLGQQLWMHLRCGVLAAHFLQAGSRRSGPCMFCKEGPVD